MEERIGNRRRSIIVTTLLLAVAITTAALTVVSWTSTESGSSSIKNHIATRGEEEGGEAAILVSAVAAVAAAEVEVAVTVALAVAARSTISREDDGVNNIANAELTSTIIKMRVQHVTTDVKLTTGSTRIPLTTRKYASSSDSEIVVEKENQQPILLKDENQDNPGRSSSSSSSRKKIKVLNVHVVPHTHDDVGWLKTVDQYYHGWNDTIQVVSVHEILTSVVEALVENPSRTFTYVEQKFFTMWWNTQTDIVKERVYKLVTETKQLTFVNGGWCMHDEAATHYMGTFVVL